MFKTILKLLFIILAMLSNKVIANKENVMSILKPLISNVAITDINKTNIEGLYEVILRKPILGIIYVSTDGRYLVQGELINIKKLTNITKEKQQYLTRQIINTIKDEDKIIFKAENEEYVIDVFTDVDCPFCQQLHAKISDINNLGITVKYYATPLISLHPKAQEKMEKIWCAKDRVKAINDYISKEILPDSKACANPVAAQMAIANQLSISGTPTIFLEDGSSAPGYIPPDVILKAVQAIRNK